MHAKKKPQNNKNVVRFTLHIYKVAHYKVYITKNICIVRKCLLACKKITYFSVNTVICSCILLVIHNAITLSSFLKKIFVVNHEGITRRIFQNYLLFLNILMYIYINMYIL